MEIIGDDKKLRALYSEARVANEAATPSFTSVWHRAQARSLKPRHAFKLSFALVTALLVLTLGSLAAWSMYSSRSKQRLEASQLEPKPGTGTAPEIKTAAAPTTKDQDKIAEKAPQTPIESTVRRSVRPRVRRPATQADSQMIASNTTTVKETTIDTWQSPTATLLSSPTDGLFKSMPQLNENANEMKSFLPGRSNDKEK